MPRFFTDAVSGDYTVLDGENGRHASRALRMRVGEAVTLCDGCGTDYSGEIERISGDEVTVHIISRQKNESESTVRITLYAGMPKADKLDLIVQKATELGAVCIAPVMTARCVSKPDAKSAEKKRERLKRIALEAAKQSGRGIVPDVCLPESFKSAVENAKGAKILFYEGGGRDIAACIPPRAEEIAVFIGPEGGFDADEVEFARAHGAETATLGPRILRTETAPLAAISIIQYVTGNMQ